MTRYRLLRVGESVATSGDEFLMTVSSEKPAEWVPVNGDNPNAYVHEALIGRYRRPVTGPLADMLHIEMLESQFAYLSKVARWWSDLINRRNTP